MEGMVGCYDTMDKERWCNRDGKGKAGLDDNNETERVGFLNCNRRDLYKYDFDKQKHLNLSAADDAFARLYAAVDSDIDAAFQKAEAASNEKSRASAVAINAEIRRTKARLLEEVPNLERLAIKKVKGLSTEELAARNDLVLALPDRIQAIPDWTAAAPKQSGGWTGSASRTEIKFDSDGQFNSE
ncbi:Syntaxin-71 [Camellia lanceoleosa]|uniref:Syntaxin-71 n=1 Tax=Camellia lanceoleosa TaxID=1840588 RepID=A0ACC0GDM9_9ERIC|nr:Syntaxin-71 [Camellia lanceoleosa]